MGWVIFIFIITSVYLLFKKITHSNDADMHHADAKKLNGNGTYSLDIVGESYYQESINKICGDKTETGHEKYITASLIPEPLNQYDENAVRVEIDGMIVGYLDKSSAKKYKTMLNNSIVPKCPGVIRGGWKRKGRGNNTEGHYGIKLDLNL